MDLLDYARYQRRRLTAVLAIGLLLIVVLAIRPGGDSTATAQVVLRPANSQAGIYASDLDRYIEVQLLTLRQPDFLRGVAETQDLSAGELADALSVERLPSSDVVTLSVSLGDGDQAVATVNALAAAFVGASSSTVASSVESGQQQLDAQLEETEQQLARVSTRIQQATETFIAQNNGVVPPAAVAAPRAAARQLYLQAQVNQIAESKANLASQLGAGNPTRVVREAPSASRDVGLSATAVAVSLAGLLALLALITSIGLALSSRVVSPSRWDRRAEGSALPPPVRFEGRDDQAQARTLRRVAAALESAGDGAASARAVTVVSYPEATERLAEATTTLLDGLRRELGVQLVEGSVAGLVGAPADHPHLLLVDSTRCELSDVDLLTSRTPAEQERMVTVMVCP